jgi:hypothetical protein
MNNKITNLEIELANIKEKHESELNSDTK